MGSREVRGIHIRDRTVIIEIIYFSSQNNFNKIENIAQETTKICYYKLDYLIQL